MRHHLTKHSDGFGPKVPLVVGASSLPRAGEGLTGEARRDDIHEPSPGSPVERSHVVPDGEWLERFVILPSHDDSSAVFVDFDGADGSPPEEFPPENSASSACEKCQLIQRLSLSPVVSESKGRSPPPPVGDEVELVASTHRRMRRHRGDPYGSADLLEEPSNCV